MHVSERDGVLTVRTGFPVTSAVLLAAAAATAGLAGLNYLRADAARTELAWAGGIVAVLLAAAWLFGEAGAFVFSASEQRFRWAWRRLFVRRSGDVPLAAVQEARCEVLPDPEGDTYRLAVATDGGVVPLTRSYGGDEERVRLAVEAIHRYLARGA